MELDNEMIYSDNKVETNEAEDIKKLNEVLSEKEFSQEILRMIIRSVEKRERRLSASKKKRKRTNMKRFVPNGSDADDERKAYNRCNISFLFKVLEKVRSCPRYVELVQSMGFADTLELQDCCIPRCFVQYIAENVNTIEEKINIGCKSILLSPQAVTDTLGTPSGNSLADSDEDSGKAAFLGIFGLSEVPSIKLFGKKILAKELLPDDVFCRCFMSVALGTFFCPNSNTKVSTKYMGAPIDVDRIKDRNWTKFIHESMMVYIKKFLKDPSKEKGLSQTLGGCIYHLAVRFLDSIQMPTTLPRIKVWKGKLIKVFCDMYMGTDGKYGVYPIRDMFETCYAMHTNKAPEDVITESII